MNGAPKKILKQKYVICLRKNMLTMMMNGECYTIMVNGCEVHDVYINDELNNHGEC